MKLSIITINKNNAQGLLETIRSVVEQEFKDLEFLVIDGASTDNSVDHIKQYSNNINYWSSEPDSGIYNAMNKGIEKSNGEYLLFLNSGDTLINRNILNEVFQEITYEDIISGVVRIYDELKKKNIVYYGPGNNELTLSELLRFSLNHQAAFIKKSLFSKLGKYDESYRVISDWVFFLNAIILNSVSYRFIDKTITVLQPAGISINSKNYFDERQRALKELIPDRILKDYTDSDIYGLREIKKNWFTWKLYVLIRKIALLFRKRSVM